MFNSLFHPNEVNISNNIYIQRFDKGLLRFSFNFYTKEEPIWFHVGISFAAGAYLKNILNSYNKTLNPQDFQDMVIEAGYEYPLDRVIHIDESENNLSFFEYIDNYIRNKKPTFNEEDLYLSYQITTDIKERYDELDKSDPDFDPNDVMYQTLISSDFNIYKIEDGSFIKVSCYNC